MSRKNSCALFVTLLAFLVCAPLVRADWNPGDPAKWVQNPDPTGFDVNATFKPSATGGGQFPFVKLLADDWKCTSKDPITDIHLWGSWLNDQVDTAPTFKLSIHRDIPAGPTVPFSQPDDSAAGTIRTYIFPPGTFTQRLDPNVPQGQTERFYDPNTGTILGTDHQIIQYNFRDLPNPFVQEGTTAAPVIYWLDVQVLEPAGSPFVFGWKTSRDPHQLDDAVFADTGAFAGPRITGWQPMTYPGATQFHPTGESMDMAFVITGPIPEPASMALTALFLGMHGRRRR